MIKQIRSVDFSEIETFLQNCFSSPTHWPEWNIAISKHYGTDFYYYIMVESNEIIGICPVHRVKTGILRQNYSGQFLFIPNGGWIFSKNYQLNPNMLPIAPLNSFVAFTLPRLNEFNVTYKQHTTITAQTLIIDLTPDIDQLWKNTIHSKRRNMIRKAEKNGITVEYDDKSNLFTFYNVYTETNKQNGLVSLSYNFFKDLFDNAKNVKYKILWAKKNKEILSGIVVAYDKNYAIYWLGFSKANTPNLGQGDLLQWEAIKTVKAHGCSYYDLCFIDKNKLPHIYKFKKGFSKNEIEVDIISKRSFSYRIVKKLKKLVHAE